jgi:NDP-sugar pyrophosphorylase family protein
MNTKITTTLCTNDALFELSGEVAQSFRPAVYEFLKSREYPWQLLGKSLADFVDQRISSVPVHERLKGNISPQAYLENKEQIVIEEGAVIEAGAYIAGPTYIESGATVRHGAYIRGQVYVSAGAVVGHTSELKGALLLSGAKAAHFAYVGDTILGHDCNLGAGTKCANLRLDHGQVPVQVGDSKVSSGLKKFGAIFGNRAQTGCNAVTNPGTILLPGAILLPNSTGQGTIVPRKAFTRRSP